jgi:hypothetical protein
VTPPSRCRWNERPPDVGASCGENVINGNNGYGNGHFDAFSVIVGHEYAEVETDMHTASDQYA